MAATVLEGVDGVHAASGSHLGYSDWLEVTQERIDHFAEAIGMADHHDAGDAVVPYLTVALSNMFLPQILEVRGISLGVNYGCDQIRFPQPVAVGTRIRAGAELTGVTDIAGGVQATTTITIEVEGASEPVCIISSVSRYLA